MGGLTFLYVAGCQNSEAFKLGVTKKEGDNLGHKKPLHKWSYQQQSY